jgi:hypothetical protein
MARQDGVHHLRHHGVFVAQNSGEQFFPALDFTDQIIAEFVFDAALNQFGLGEGTGA